VDAGSGLAQAIRTARGAQAHEDDLLTFKRAVLTTLGPLATTVLVDATLGPRLLPDFPEGCTPMMAYEADVYRISDADRITVLPENLDLGDFPGLGVRQVKFFMWYAPGDDADLNRRKQDLVADIGARCRDLGLTFLMEPLVYDRHAKPGTAAFAAIKPDLVRRAVEVFAAPRFAVDILKVEVPVDLGFVEGWGQAGQSRDAALGAFRSVIGAADGLPVVFLSAGVPFDRFEASLALARACGAPFAGFMCGRAIWTEAIDVFGAGGEQAMTDWLRTMGRSRLSRLIDAAEGRHAA
jgi:tagatose 1,6-diphosphate aldolase